MIKKLLSVPHALVKSKSPDIITNGEWFIDSDPIGEKIGSGGGAVNLIINSYNSESKGISFEEWFNKHKFIIINSGGSSRRLPSYSHLGKANIPVPVFRWSIGQNLNQTLIDFQEELYNKIINNSPSNYRLLIGSGDVLILSNDRFNNLPEADILCFGLWTDEDVASKHGVFFSRRDGNYDLSFMLQKPNKSEIGDLSLDFFYLMDSGIWLLNKKASNILFKKTGCDHDKIGKKDAPDYFDLYSDFGSKIGDKSILNDEGISKLKVKIYPINDGEFYHFGTSADMIKSCLKIQNRTNDQREIWHLDTKPHPSIFVQNSITNISFTDQNENIWIENSFIASNWKLCKNHVITGIPENDWKLVLNEGICIDINPIDSNKYCLRVYSYNDAFDGSLNDNTKWLGQNLKDWLNNKGINKSTIMSSPEDDILDYRLFPVINDINEAGKLINWIIDPGMKEDLLRDVWVKSQRLSFNEICTISNLDRLHQQRTIFQRESLIKLSANSSKSIFYQLDLKKTAKLFSEYSIGLPAKINTNKDIQRKISDQMFRALTNEYAGHTNNDHEDNAFRYLRDSILSHVASEKIYPQRNILNDQIIWGRSPIRLDLAGGWTDTPPYCIFHGGTVVNMAVDLNGQAPLQVFIRPVKNYHIVFRSIDLGYKEIIESYDELGEFHHLGSPFSIPKAALALAGFNKSFSANNYSCLKDQLKDFGCGLEITLLSAVPKGSGLGTSSILAATVLGTLSVAFDLNWTKNTIGNKTLALEQMLTTGGGWQDQYGGIFHGIKTITSLPSLYQNPKLSWLPSDIFTNKETSDLILLYYTGITRVAKNILSEIVKGMFVNSKVHLDILAEMKIHARETSEAIQSNNYEKLSIKIQRSWELNNMLDYGTNTPEIQSILDIIKDFSIGYKLLGAGGGGYLMIFSKDINAVKKIKSLLTDKRSNNNARFVDFNLSSTGLNITSS